MYTYPRENNLLARIRATATAEVAEYEARLAAVDGDGQDADAERGDLVAVLEALRKVAGAVDLPAAAWGMREVRGCVVGAVGLDPSDWPELSMDARVARFDAIERMVDGDDDIDDPGIEALLDEATTIMGVTTGLAWGPGGAWTDPAERAFSLRIRKFLRGPERGA